VADFEAILGNITREAGKLAVGELASFKDQIIEDATSFAQRKKDDLLRWGEALAAGTIDQDEFDLLARGAKSLLLMRAEAYAGIAKARLQRLRAAILDIVFKAATGLIP